METGWDFPADQCRYQIIAKVPFIDSRSLIIKARSKSDKTYLNYLTAQAIIQMVGRGMRSADDWCETYIIDDHIEWFWQAARKQGLWPKWFQTAYRREAGVPDPIDPANFGIKRR
jgi:Rad3-related DNA helicase